MTQAQVNKKYKGKYVEVTKRYDYSNQSYYYEVKRVSKTIRENMTLGEDVGTILEYTR